MAADDPSGPGNPSDQKRTGRVLGLDLGDARIGVAISDPDRTLAVPLGTVHVGQPPGELKAIASLVREHDVTLIVLGYPLSLSGDQGPAASVVDAFADALRGFLKQVPVELQDERFTTTEAERRLREAGVSGRDRREVVDRTAAAVVLQAWLDTHRPDR